MTTGGEPKGRKPATDHRTLAVKSYALGDFFGEGRDELIDAIPHAAALGMKVIRVAAAAATLRLDYRREFVGDPARGVVFGGVITTLMDQALGLAVSCSLEDLRPIATLDLRIDYLRPADPGKPLFARAECYKVTRDVAFARGVAYDSAEDDPFATSQATFMLGAVAAGNNNAFISALEEYAKKPE
jgi:uncharacterized protein (TIGR00369 family)